MFEDGVLALDPRIVQGAGAAFAAGPLLHDAVGDLERALHGLHGVAQRYLFGRSSEAGTSPPFPRWSPQDRRGRASPSRGRADGAGPWPLRRSRRRSPARRSPHHAQGKPAPAARNAPRSRVRASSVPSVVLKSPGNTLPHHPHPRESVRPCILHTHTYYVIVKARAVGSRRRPRGEGDVEQTAPGVRAADARAIAGVRPCRSSTRSCVRPCNKPCATTSSRATSATPSRLRGKRRKRWNNLLQSRPRDCSKTSARTA